MTFAEAMASDAAAFANPDEFGVSVVYSGDGQAYDIVIERGQDPETGHFVWYGIARVSDIPTPVAGETLVTASHTYTVISREPSDEGDIFVTMRLER